MKKRIPWNKGKPYIWIDETINKLQEILMMPEATNWSYVARRYGENRDLLKTIAYKNKLKRPYIKRGGDHCSENFKKKYYGI